MNSRENVLRVAANDDQPFTEPGEGGNPRADVIIEAAMKGFATDPESATPDVLKRWYQLIVKTHGEKAGMDDLIDLQNFFADDPDKTGNQFRIVQQVIREINQDKRQKKDFLNELLTD